VARFKFWLRLAKKFTLAASELNTGGKIYVVFKIGSSADGVNFKDGMTLDNVSIKEVLE
jgi:hypothetical protein